jgi:hypothetical protein
MFNKKYDQMNWENVPPVILIIETVFFEKLYFRMASNKNNLLGCTVIGKLVS